MKGGENMKNYLVIFLIIVITCLAFIYLELKFDEIEMKMIRIAEAIIKRN